MATMATETMATEVDMSSHGKKKADPKTEAMYEWLATALLGVWILWGLWRPLWEWRGLSGWEVPIDLIFGTIGIVLFTGHAVRFLAARGKTGAARIIGVLGVAILVFVVIFKPNGYDFTKVPPILPSPTSNAAFGQGPGFSTQGGQVRQVVTPPAPVVTPPAATGSVSPAPANTEPGFGTMKCADLSPHSRKLLPRCQ